MHQQTLMNYHEENSDKQIQNTSNPFNQNPTYFSQPFDQPQTELQQPPINQRKQKGYHGKNKRKSRKFSDDLGQNPLHLNKGQSTYISPQQAQQNYTQRMKDSTRQPEYPEQSISSKPNIFEQQLQENLKILEIQNSPIPYYQQECQEPMSKEEDLNSNYDEPADENTGFFNLDDIDDETQHNKNKNNHINDNYQIKMRDQNNAPSKSEGYQHDSRNDDILLDQNSQDQEHNNQDYPLNIKSKSISKKKTRKPSKKENIDEKKKTRKPREIESIDKKGKTLLFSEHMIKSNKYLDGENITFNLRNSDSSVNIEEQIKIENILSQSEMTKEQKQTHLKTIQTDQNVLIEENKQFINKISKMLDKKRKYDLLGFKIKTIDDHIRYFKRAFLIEKGKYFSENWRENSISHIRKYIEEYQKNKEQITRKQLDNIDIIDIINKI